MTREQIEEWRARLNERLAESLKKNYLPEDFEAVRAANGLMQEAQNLCDLALLGLESEQRLTTCPRCSGEVIPDGYCKGMFVHEEGCDLAEVMDRNKAAQELADAVTHADLFRSDMYPTLNAKLESYHAACGNKEGV